MLITTLARRADIRALRSTIVVYGVRVGRPYGRARCTACCYQRMHGPLAAALAERGNRVITLDLLGHGESDRPRDMWRYSMPFFGEQTIALLDHLELDKAVVGGTSLGANTTLEVAAPAPERLRGMVIEMPVLDNALLAAAVAFPPLLSLKFGEPVMRLVAGRPARSRAACRLPGRRRARHAAPGARARAAR